MKSSAVGENGQAELHQMCPAGGFPREGFPGYH